MNYIDWYLSAPVNITWEITHRCNLNCIHCLSNSGAEIDGELEINECFPIVDQLAELGVFQINFGGGEPFLRNNFIDLLSYIHKKEIVTCISTNGTIINDELIDFLYHNPLVNIQVSLDGATPEVNDKIRGNGTFKKIIKGIEQLSKINVPLSINTVVTSINCSDLDQLKKIAESYGANLRISRFRPSGRARDTWESMRLGLNQLENLSEWLGENLDVLTGDSFFSIQGNSRRELGLDMCGACKMTCCIDPYGSVYPCAFLQIEEFNAGNLKTTTLGQIWNHSWVFQRFRNLEPESCKKCPRYSICHGGCPAIAYFVKNDLNSPDPECLLAWNKSKKFAIHS